MNQNNKGGEMAMDSKIWTKHFVMIVIINTCAFLGLNMSVSGFPAFVSSISHNEMFIALATSCSAIAALISRPLAGRYTSTKPVIVLLLGSLFMTIGPAICCITSSVIFVLCMRTLQGFGWGLTSTACSVLIIRALPKNRLSEGIGYSGSISSIASAFAPSLAIAVFNHYGSAIMLILIAGSALLSFTITILINSTRTNDNATKCIIQRKKEKINIMNHTVLSAVLISIISISYSPIVTFISNISYYQTVNTLWFFVPYSIATVLSRPITGVFVDKKGFTLPSLIALLLAGGSLVLLSLSQHAIEVLIAGIFSGLSTGIGMNVFQPMAIKDTKVDEQGKSISIFLFGFDSGMFLGPIIGSTLISLLDVRRMLLIMSIFSFVGCIAFLTFRMRNKNKLEVQRVEE